MTFIFRERKPDVHNITLTEDVLYCPTERRRKDKCKINLTVGRLEHPLDILVEDNMRSYFGVNDVVRVP